jgi:TP901 family phage tail tape measure protein
MAERYVPIIIRVSGGKEGAAEVRLIKSAFDELDRADLSHAQAALANVGGASGLRQLQEQVRAVREIGDSVQQAGQKIRSVGNDFTTYVTLPIVAGAAAAVKAAADVEQAVANISTIKPEINTSEVTKALNDLSTRVPQTAQQLGDGLYNIFSSITVTQAEGIALLEKFAKGATAAVTDTNTFGTAVLGVLNAYKLSVADADHVSDVFFNTVAAGVVTGAELASSLGPVTAAAKAAGVSFDQLGALIVGVTKEGGDAAQNINNLNNFLIKLTDTSAQKALNGLGVATADANGNFRSTIDVLTDLKAKLDPLSESARAAALDKIFPDAQAKQGAQTLLSQLDAVKDALRVNETTSGAAAQAYAKVSATASVQFTLLKNVAVAALATIGAAILPHLTPLVTYLAQVVPPAVNSLVAAFQSASPVLQGIVVGFLAIAAAIGPVLVVVGTIVAAVGGLITTVAGAAAAVGGFVVLAKVVAISLLALPVVLVQVAAVLGVVGAAAYTLYTVWTQNIGGVRDFALEIFTTLQSIVRTALGAIQAFWATYGGNIKATAQSVFQGVLGVVTSVIGAVVSFARENFGIVVSFVRDNWPLISAYAKQSLTALYIVVQVVLAAVKAFWAVWGSSIIDIVKAAFDLIKNVVQGALRIVLNIIKLGMALATGDWRAAWEAFKGILSGVWQVIWGIVKNAFLILVNIIKGFVKSFLLFGIELGANLLAGISQGIAQKIGEVRAKLNQVVNLVKDVPVVGWAIRSPSRLFAEYGRNLIEGLIVGLATSGAKLTAAVQKEVVNRVKAAKGDLTKAGVELAAILTEGPQARRNRAHTEEINEVKAKLEELVKLRRELGIPVELPLPRTLEGIDATLEGLRQRAENIKAADELLKEFDSDLNKLGANATNLERVNALLADPAKSKGISDATRELLLMRAGMRDARNETERLNASLKQIQEDGAKRLNDINKQIALIGVEGSRQKRAIEIEFEQPQDRTLEEKAARIAQQKAELEALGRLDAQTFLNDRLREYNDLLKDATNLTARQRLELELQKPELASLTEAERERLRVLADQVDARRQFDELTRQLSESFNRILTAGVKDGFRGLLKAAFAEIKNFGLKLLSDIISALSQSLARTVAGGLLGGNSGSGGSGGGFFGSILGSIGKLFGLGGNAARTPNFNPAAGNILNFGGATNAGVNPFASPAVRAAFGGSQSPVSFTAQAATQAAQKAAIRDAVKEAGTTTAGAATQVAGKFSLGQFGTQAAALAPFLGLSIGSSLGGQSGLGQILGGAGGLLGGLVLAASTGAIGGSLGSLFALSGVLGPAALVAAPLLLLGGILLGRAKQRRQDEGQRDQLSGDIAQAINQATTTIRRASQVSEITGTLAQLEQRYSEYLQAVNAIKTRSVRESALRNQVPVHRARIDELKQLAQRRQAGLELDAKLVGEFATGGTYRVPGLYQGVDDHYVKVASGERIIVLTPDQDREATPLIAPYLRRARVPGFAEGGTFGGAGGRQQAAGGEGDINIEVTLLLSNKVAIGPAESADILVQALDTDTGRRANVKVIQKAITDDEIDPNRRRR